jgi:uncharacterized protein YqgC (DUF456 family)
MSWWAWIVVGLLMVTGLVGIVVPVLPSVGLIWAGLLVAGLFSDWTLVTLPQLAVWGVISLLAAVGSFWGGSLAARVSGGKRWAGLGALAGAIVGLFMGGPVGLFIGAGIGAFAGAWWSERKAEQALKVAGVTMLGTLLGIALQAAVALSAVGWFVWRVVTAG